MRTWEFSYKYPFPDWIGFISSVTAGVAASCFKKNSELLRLWSGGGYCQGLWDRARNLGSAHQVVPVTQETSR